VAHCPGSQRGVARIHAQRCLAQVDRDAPGDAGRYQQHLPLPVFSELRTIINIRCSGRFPGACWRGEQPLDVAFAEAGGGVAEIDRNAGAQAGRRG
jgi:hypothetical protein